MFTYSLYTFARSLNTSLGRDVTALSEKSLQMSCNKIGCYFEKILKLIKIKLIVNQSARRGILRPVLIH